MCVLGCCDEDKTPDREQMECLLMAGLGKAKIVFPNKKATYINSVYINSLISTSISTYLVLDSCVDLLYHCYCCNDIYVSWGVI